MPGREHAGDRRNDNIAKQFRSPGAEYGPVPLWWWDGDELDDERLTTQLEALSDGGIPSVCFSQVYPDGPTGDELQYFNDDWWDRMHHVARECERLDMELWVHDETFHLSPPNFRGYWQHRIRASTTEHEEVRGKYLTRIAEDVSGPNTVRLSIPDDLEILTSAAYPRDSDGTVLVDQAIDLTPRNGELHWEADEGDWHVAVIGTRAKGLCYTSPDVVEIYLDLHYEEYRRRLGDLVGNVLVGTFEDELVILDSGVPCDRALLDRFEKVHGYDPVRRLVGLYEDIGRDTAQFRIEYYDVVTRLIEENWFKPLFEWHEEHGLNRSHDNWGRNNIAAGTAMYGDYYRTMRWYQAPGYDDGWPTAIGDRNFFDAKLSASIAACYDRERVWGELFHSSGWAFTPEDQLAGIVENYCYGANLYDNPILYYGTLGGWFDFAPSDVHFRQPYWEDIEKLNDAATRLSYLFSQGDPVVDVAMLYPTTSLHADWHPDDGIRETGQYVDEQTREIAELVYKGGTDLVLTDPESLINAGKTDGSLSIQEMDIPIVLLGPLTTIRRETLEAIRTFYEAGGIVMAAGQLPTELVGSGDDEKESDTELTDTLAYIFGDVFRAAQVGDIDGHHINEQPHGGVGVLAGDDVDLGALVDELVDTDVRRSAPDVYHTHRKIGDHDAYLLFNARDEERTIDCSLRGSGAPERWNPLTGDIDSVSTFKREDGYIKLELTFPPHGFEVITLVSDITDNPHVVETSLSTVNSVDECDAGVTVTGRIRSPGTFTADIEDGENRRSGTVDEVDVPEPIEIEGTWELTLEPTLDNRWGDFRYPPEDRVLGAEIREIEHRSEGPNEDGRQLGWHRKTVETDDWVSVDRTYGPYFWRRADVDSVPTVSPREDSTEWERYEFSQKFGKPGTHPYTLGYNTIVSDEYLISPDGDGETYFWTTLRSDQSQSIACHYGPGMKTVKLGELKIDTAGFNHEPRIRETVSGEGTAIVHLPAGKTEVLLCVEPGIETYFAVESPDKEAISRDMRYEPRLRWFQEETIAFDYQPWIDTPVGWYRFTIPVGTRSFDLPVRGSRRVWVDGKERSVADSIVEFDCPLERPATVAVRVEHERDAYGGAAYTRSPSVETDPVDVELGRWESLGLGSYSGRARYRRTVTLPDFAPDDRVVLDLGGVGVSASVAVNGTVVGSTFRRPFELDITAMATAGENDIEVIVANTVANHFDAETPMRYVETTLDRVDDDKGILSSVDADNVVSGLLGPVTVRVERCVTIRVPE